MTDIVLTVDYTVVEDEHHFLIVLLINNYEMNIAQFLITHVFLMKFLIQQMLSQQKLT